VYTLRMVINRWSVSVLNRFSWSGFVDLSRRRKRLTGRLVIGLLWGSVWAPQVGLACGGFFCSLVPINQAGEQIIFKQQGNDVTAIVQIQYVGQAEDFSWVVPVPGIPTFAAGSNLLFQTLEPMTRPQFNLLESGEVCLEDLESDSSVVNLGGAATEGDAVEVEVLLSETVGPYDVQVIQSEDPEALATWLVDNNYDLSERGAELIEPYVTSGMNFVVLKLSSGQTVGDLRPLVMNYMTEQVMIPIRLTAVAAQDDMGVLVWILGEGRAVPTNYPHVTVNYSQIDWFNGTQTAYASYQQLVADAMDEAGGQGFATDYAGTDLDVWESLSRLQDGASGQLTQLGSIQGRSAYMRSALLPPGGLSFATLTGIVINQSAVFEGRENEVFFNDDLLEQTFNDAQWDAVRSAIETEINDSVIEPINNSFSVFEAPHYLTRMYTRLSAAEMTLDPTFDFNLTMASQTIVREASLVSTCSGGSTQWNMTLGQGTDRDGELIMQGVGLPPTFFSTLPVVQSFVQSIDLTRSEGAAERITSNSFKPVRYVSTDSGLEVVAEVAPVRKKRRGGSVSLELLGLLAGLMVLRWSRARRCDQRCSVALR